MGGFYKYGVYLPLAFIGSRLTFIAVQEHDYVTLIALTAIGIILSKILDKVSKV